MMGTENTDVLWVESLESQDEKLIPIENESINSWTENLDKIIEGRNWFSTRGSSQPYWRKIKGDLKVRYVTPSWMFGNFLEMEQSISRIQIG